MTQQRQHITRGVAPAPLDLENCPEIPQADSLHVLPAELQSAVFVLKISTVPLILEGGILRKCLDEPITWTVD